jgi:hypothetical protein
MYESDGDDDDDDDEEDDEDDEDDDEDDDDDACDEDKDGDEDEDEDEDADADEGGDEGKDDEEYDCDDEDVEDDDDDDDDEADGDDDDDEVVDAIGRSKHEASENKSRQRTSCFKANAGAGLEDTAIVQILVRGGGKSEGDPPGAALRPYTSEKSSASVGALAMSAGWARDKSGGSAEHKQSVATASSCEKKSAAGKCVPPAPRSNHGPNVAALARGAPAEADPPIVPPSRCSY